MFPVHQNVGNVSQIHFTKPQLCRLFFRQYILSYVAIEVKSAMANQKFYHGCHIICGSSPFQVSSIKQNTYANEYPPQ